MIANLALVAGAALVTYATRLAGFAIAGRLAAGQATPTVRAVDRFLVWAPVAAFSALIVPDLASGPGLLSARLAGAVAAALAVWRIGRLWAGLVVGFSAFWVVQVVLHGGL